MLITSQFGNMIYDATEHNALLIDKHSVFFKIPENNLILYSLGLK